MKAEYRMKCKRNMDKHNINVPIGHFFVWFWLIENQWFILYS